MKVWKSYGSEHSLNLVIIGRFKDVSDAEEFKVLSESIESFLRGVENFDVETDRFPPEIFDFLSDKKIFYLAPHQLGHFLYDKSIEIKGNELRVFSDDDLHGFITAMVHYGAKVEVFSAHDHPESKG
jgi:hypothetical protein